MENKKEIETAYDNLIKSADLTAEQVAGLSDGEVEEISETLNKVVEENPSLKAIADLPSNNGVDEAVSTLKNEENVMVTVNINPVTGEQYTVPTEEKTEEEKSFVTETFEDLLKGVGEPEFDKIDIDEDIIIKDAIEKFDLDDMEVYAFAKLVKDFQKGEVVNVYERLPLKLKTFVDTSVAMNAASAPKNQIRNIKKSIAKEIVESFIVDLATDKIGIDFEKELNNIFNEASEDMQQLYVDSYHEKIESVRRKAGLIENEEDKTKLLNLAEAMEEAFSLNKFKENVSRIKIKKFDLEKPQKIFRSFNAKYERSVYNIYNVNMLPDILRKVYKEEEYSDETIWKFVLSFCKYCDPMKPEKVEEHAFMYYTIMNIIYLNTTINGGAEVEFTADLKRNIAEIFDIIEL